MMKKIRFQVIATVQDICDWIRELAQDRELHCCLQLQGRPRYEMMEAIGLTPELLTGATAVWVNTVRFFTEATDGREFVERNPAALCFGLERPHLGELGETVIGTVESSDSSRLAIWSAAVKRWKKQTVTGAELIDPKTGKRVGYNKNARATRRALGGFISGEWQLVTFPNGVRYVFDVAGEQSS